MREGTYFIIRDSRVLGGTRHVKIYGCYMSKSQDTRVVLVCVAAGYKEKKQRNSNITHAGLVACWACLAWIRPRTKERSKSVIRLVCVGLIQAQRVTGAHKASFESRVTV